MGIRSAGVDVTVVHQNDWNTDKMDGTGKSGIDLKNGKAGVIFQTIYTYYGYGPVIWWVLDTRSGVVPRMWIAHIQGAFEIGTSTDNSNLPVRIENTGTTGLIYAAGRQASVIGEFAPRERSTSVVIPNTTVGADWTPIASAQRKVGNQFDPFSFRTDAVEIENTGEETAYVAVILAPTLAEATWGGQAELRSASETCLNFDFSATSFTGGEIISRLIRIPAASGRGSNTTEGQAAASRGIRIPRDQVVSLVARSSGGTVTLSGVAVLAEEW